MDTVAPDNSILVQKLSLRINLPRITSLGHFPLRHEKGRGSYEGVEVDPGDIVRGQREFSGGHCPGLAFQWELFVGNYTREIFIRELSENCNGSHHVAATSF